MSDRPSDEGVPGAAPSDVSTDVSTRPASTQTAPTQSRNPLHGITLEAMLIELVAHFGWAELGARIPINSFNVDPSIASSLRFLRRTPWAREKVEGLFLFMRREQVRLIKAG